MLGYTGPNQEKLGIRHRVTWSTNNFPQTIKAWSKKLKGLMLHTHKNGDEFKVDRTGDRVMELSDSLRETSACASNPVNTSYPETNEKRINTDSDAEIKADSIKNIT